MQRIPPEALALYWGALLTEPLSLGDLARLFRVHRATVRAMLAEMDGIVRCGQFWRVPLRHMPPAYHLAIGVMPPVEFDGSRRFPGMPGSAGADLPYNPPHEREALH